MAVIHELVFYVPSEYTMWLCSQAVCDLVIKSVIWNVRILDEYVYVDEYVMLKSAGSKHIPTWFYM